MFLSTSSFPEFEEQSTWKNKFVFFRFVFPFITIFFSSWLGFLRIPGLSSISPDYGLCVLYFWTLYRPDLVPLSLLLGIGVLIDIVSGGVIGKTPFLWFLVYGIILSQRHFLIKANFVLLWAALGGLFLLEHGVEWISICLFKHKETSLVPFCISFLLTLGVYPFISFLLSRVRSIFSLSLSDTSL